MAFNEYSADYVRRKSDLLLTNLIMNQYYINKDISQEDLNSLPMIYGSIITIDHLKHCYYKPILIYGEYHKMKCGVWFLTYYYKLNGSRIECFMYYVWSKIENCSINSLNIFEECETWNDLINLIELNPATFKLMIFSFKQFELFCKWLLKNNLSMDDKCSLICNNIIKWVNTLEFKTLENISNQMIDDELKEFYNSFQ